MQDNLVEAERAARQTLDLDRASTSGRLMLGLSLVLQKKFTLEAEKSLRKALPDFAKAGLMLAPVLAARGQIESAKTQLQRYLASGDSSGVDLANQWIQQLNSIPSVSS